MGEGLLVLNKQGEVEYINQAALTQLGFAHRELINKKVHDIIHYKDVDENPLSLENCPIHMIFKTEKPILYEESFVHKDGFLFPVFISATPIFEDGRVLKVIVVFQDITEREKQREELLRLEKAHNKDYADFINSLVNLIEKRDAYTAGHSERVAHYCELIAKEMDFEKEEISLLVNAARLHDIGKISTPDAILLKPDKLDDLEYKLIQHHLNNGHDILSAIESYQDIAEVMRHHHERYDGEGYPQGVHGDDITLISHVMIVADAFDAMTSNRIYKPRMNIKAALNELQKERTKQFHPLVVDAAIVAFANLKDENHNTQLPQNDLEYHRFNYFFKDRLTNLFLPEYERLIVELYFKNISPKRYIIRLQNFSDYNKKEGWNAGDVLLREFAQWLMQRYANSTVFRIEGDDFMILSETTQNVDVGEIQTQSVLNGTKIGVIVE